MRLRLRDTSHSEGHVLLIVGREVPARRTLSDAEATAHGVGRLFFTRAESNCGRAADVQHLLTTISKYSRRGQAVGVRS